MIFDPKILAKSLHAVLLSMGFEVCVCVWEGGEDYITTTVYQPAKGGERAYSHTSCIEGEMLDLNQNLTRCHTASLHDLNLVTASISPSIQDV